MTDNKENQAGRNARYELAFPRLIAVNRDRARCRPGARYPIPRTCGGPSRGRTTQAATTSAS
jgi:hypothetical protein